MKQNTLRASVRATAAADSDMKTCLIIDDSEVIRKVARGVLEKLNFEADEADNGAAALERCLQQMPDAILLDSHLPTMGTVEFLSTLRAMTDGRKPVVLYCTTDNDPTEIARALSAGADEYLLKPFDRETMRTKMQAVGLL
jgi:two-component system chemotaxis response regulator CheY